MSNLIYIYIIKVGDKIHYISNRSIYEWYPHIYFLSVPYNLFKYPLRYVRPWLGIIDNMAKTTIKELTANHQLVLLPYDIPWHASLAVWMDVSHWFFQLTHKYQTTRAPHESKRSKASADSSSASETDAKSTINPLTIHLHSSKLKHMLVAQAAQMDLWEISHTVALIIKAAYGSNIFGQSSLFLWLVNVANSIHCHVR